MFKDLVSICPRCSGKLIATKLCCNNCELELSGNFNLSKFDYLTEEETQFLESFLSAQGNFSVVQSELDMSYPAVKKRFNDIIEKLGLSSVKPEVREESPNPYAISQPIYETDSLVICKIKEKLNQAGGRAIIPLYSSDPCDITYDSNGKGLVSSKIPFPNQLTWEVFDASLEVLLNNDGRIKKGNARSGAKVGSENLPLNSLEGYLAHRVHGIEIGKTSFGPGFVVAAVLDWAGICNNERGFISIKQSFMDEMKREDS
ncbi:MAG: DUF2089 family protein [Bacillota bacterium]|nr:DUF2089 family protein [Bacillota bacterium]